ncbi:hypothetical protein BOTBODRAFT_174762 [Botryobasidium botryosum FD-172 SS1]|uniref:NYN domain-containing protein n=1 Tax=Botryobasidium botryosum (strain FD-172 SS1) TaxID=930990 RepID=A0A067MGD6_BOTB1|nr:hypothetical protein BOTBODRAFT_174762 [Botryobasidium botryosum FD-172 SS1]
MSSEESTSRPSIEPRSHGEYMEALKAHLAEREKEEGVGYWPGSGETSAGQECHYFWHYSGVEARFAEWYGEGYLSDETLSLPALRYLVTRDRDFPGTSFAVTSSTRDFADWRDNGISVQYMPKVQTASGKWKEQAVEEVLAYEMFQTIWPFARRVLRDEPKSSSRSGAGLTPSFERTDGDGGPSTPSPLPIIVLVTGDGAPGEYDHEGFPADIDNALFSGLPVKVWGWKAKLHEKILALRGKYPRQLKIHYFDEYAPYLVNCGFGGCTNATTDG